MTMWANMIHKFNKGDIVKFVHSNEYLLITDIILDPKDGISAHYDFLVLYSDKRRYGNTYSKYEIRWMQQLYEMVA